MRVYWQKAVAFYEAMAKREQLLVVLMLLFVVFMLWYGIIWGLIESKHKSYINQKSRLNQEAKTLQDDISLQNARLAKDPNKVIREKKAQLEADIKELGVRLGLYSQQLLTPQGMLTALKDITVSTKGVDIKAVDVLPDKEDEMSADAGRPLYRHGVRITLLSDYFTTMAYLQKIEALPSRLFWDKLDYRVIKYPEAEVTFEIHTLSEKKNA